MHSASEGLAAQLMLLEADVTHKLGRQQNGQKRSAADLPAPPADALRQLHPLFFAEPLKAVRGALVATDADQKRQLGALLAVFAWLLRLVGRAEHAQGIEAVLETVPAPGGRTRRADPPPSPPPVHSPQPPPGKRSGTGSSGGGSSGKARAGGSSRTSSRTAAAAPEHADASSGGVGSPDSAAPSPPRPSAKPAPCTVPSCTNVLKGAEAVKKAVQAVGLSTEFAPVNALATGYGRAVCSVLQDMLDLVATKVQPAARRPRYHEEVEEPDGAGAAEEEGGCNQGEGIDDDDGAMIGASYPMPGSSGDHAEEEEEAYFRPDERPAPQSAPSSSTGRGGGRGSGGGGRPLPEGGSGPGRPRAGEQVDPSAWRAEHERLRPLLSRIHLPAEGGAGGGGGAAVGWGDWHGRWQQFKEGAAGLSAAAPEAVAALSRSGAGLGEELERIAAAERRLNSGSEAQLREYRAARQRLEDLQVWGGGGRILLVTRWVGHPFRWSGGNEGCA